MRIYEIIDHPADLKLKVFGTSLENLFCDLAQAIAREMGGEKLEVRNGKWERIEIEAPDLFTLFVDFASEIIYRSDANNKIYTNCEIEEISENKLKAKISGVEAEKKLDIKAATYHEGYVEKVNDHWEAVVLFDI